MPRGSSQAARPEPHRDRAGARGPQGDATQQDFSSATGGLIAKGGILPAHASSFNGLWHFPAELPADPGACRLRFALHDCCSFLLSYPASPSRCQTLVLRSLWQLQHHSRRGSCDPLKTLLTLKTSQQGWGPRRWGHTQALPSSSLCLGCARCRSQPDTTAAAFLGVQGVA